MSAPLDMLNQPIVVGSMIAKAMSAGSSSVKIQIYQVLEIIEIPKTRYRYTSERDAAGKFIRVEVPWMDYKLRAQAVRGSFGSVPTKPSLLEALHSLLVLPQDFLDSK